MLVEVSGSQTGRGGVATRCSLARGKSMSPGIQQAPYYWRDVIMGPPPRRRERGDCLHVTFHGTDDTGDVRLAFTTVVRVDPGLDKDSTDDDVVLVEERLSVQRRMLQELIDREKAFSDRFAMRSRARLAHSLVAQRRYANKVQSAFLAAILIQLIRIQAKVGHAAIRGTRALLRGLVVLPEKILTHAENVSIHLASRTGRRTIRQALRDPKSATPQEKSLVLVVIAFALVAAVLILNTVFSVVIPAGASGYQRVLGDFTASLLSVLALPIPAEPLLIASTLAVGATLAFTGLFVGKMIGSWMLFLLGDSLFDAIEKKTAKSPRMKRGVTWMQSNADRWGLLMLVIINSVPLMPDLLVYVFAVSGMRFRSFMLGIGIGTAIKFGAIIIGVNIVGPELVQAFFEHPIATIRGTPP